MTGIVLSASVRQNLLSLQSTSQLLATTQNDLATGNKVNSALDNPTNFFTAQSLNSRASDISNLLDSVGNGVQVLQAANTGITSLKSLLDSAKSIANQALQASAGYSQKSEFSATITGATANNLLGTATPATSATVTAGNFTNLNVSATGAAGTHGSLTTATTFSAPIDVSAGAAATHGTATGGTFSGPIDLSSAGSVAFSIAVDGASSPTAITINAAAVSAYNTANSSDTVTASSLSQSDFAKVANYELAQNSVAATVDGSGSSLVFTSGSTGANSSVAITAVTDSTSDTGLSSVTSAGGQAAGTDGSLSFDLGLDGSASPTTITIDANALSTYNGDPTNSAAQISDSASGLTGADVAKLINYQYGSDVASFDSTSNKLTFTSTSTGTNSNVAITNEAVTGATSNTTGIADASGTAGSAAGADASEDFTLTVDGTDHSVDISKAAVDTYNAAHSSATLDASNLGADDVAKLINSQVGSSVASVVGGALTFTSGTAGSTSNVALSAVTTAGGATGSTGVVTTATTPGTDANGGLSGLELTIGSTAGGTATDITFGTGPDQVSTLNDLNAKLADNNLMATIDTHGTLTISTTNNNSSATVGDVGGSATDTGNAFAAAAGSQTGPVQDASSQQNRAGLVSQFNEILDQIKTTAQDSSFNGVNLLNGDLLQLTFNETGTSTLNIQGNTDDPAGLGLSNLIGGTDFLDNSGTNKIISAIDSASNTLDSQASTLGSNLSIVQIRQTFSNGMINVLQTGASNLTLADPNELAADSQALSTRQSIAVSALALANQSQQSVLQLLQG